MPSRDEGVLAAGFEDDLRQQPEVLARLLREGRGRAEQIAERVRAHGAAFAVLAARGTSDNAARYGQYILGVRDAMVACLAAPSIFTRYHARPRLGTAFVVGLSQSGQSPDVVAVLAEGRRQGAITLAITNEPTSPLAAAAELTFPLLAGTEHAVAATKTYTAELMALAMLSAALDTDDGKTAWDALATVPDLVARTIDLNLALGKAARKFRRRRHLVVLGRGYNLSTAFEIALKVKETCGVMADPYSSADFLHGPVALLERGLPLMVISPATAAFEDLQAAMALGRERGARILAVSDSPAILDTAEVRLPLPTGVPEWLSPMVAVVPGQLWALALARARGLTADAPRGLTKVTLTR